MNPKNDKIDETPILVEIDTEVVEMPGAVAGGAAPDGSMPAPVAEAEQVTAPVAEAVPAAPSSGPSGTVGKSDDVMPGPVPGNAAPPARRKKRHGFSGYTLDEIRMRKVVNELKTDMVMERIKMLVSPEKKGEANTIRSYINGFDNVMKYVDIAMLAYGITRRVTRFFRHFSRRR